MSLYSMNKNAIIAVLFKHQGSPDTDGPSRVGIRSIEGEEERKDYEKNQNETAARAFGHCSAGNLLLCGSAGDQYPFDRILGISARAWNPRRADLYQEEKSEQV